MLTVFHFTIPLSIAQHSLRWLQAAILNLFSESTRLSSFFYYMTAGIFHFHTKIEQKVDLYVFLLLLKLFTTSFSTILPSHSTE